MKQKLVLFICLSVLLIACKPKKAELPVDEAVAETVVQKEIPELEAGEIFYKSKDPFGGVTQLTGKHIEFDSLVFKVSEAEMIVKDNLLAVKNRAGEHVVMQFRLPDLELQSQNGIFGSGPDEFQDAHLVPAVDTSLHAYVFESTNQKIYQLDKKGKLTQSPFSLTPGKHQRYSDKQLVNVGPNDFMFTETSATGKSIYRATQEGDSVVTREIFNLGLNPKRKSWTNYIGDFAVNPKQNRVVYAYKYFKMIKFMDMEAKAIRTINFEKEEFDESTNYKINGMDQNVTHYWGICAQDDFVYCLYSGRTPFDVVKEGGKGLHYIFVEQYDWNGNPVANYKLDHWGYFTVDGKNRKIYQMSTNDDDPFFVYDMP